jgi:capsular polysaccharide biosynthesis protein
MEEDTIDLKKLGEIIKKRLKLILLIILACTVITGLLSYFVIPPTYEASTSIIIGKAPDQHNTTESSYSNDNDIYMYQKLIKTYASIAKSDMVSDKTAEWLNNGIKGKEIQKATTVTPETDTQILDIKCRSGEPEIAQKMANVLTATFIEESQKIYPTDNIKIMDEAKLPEKPAKPKKLLNIAIAFFIGIIGSIGIAFMLEYMDNTIKTEEDVAKLLQLPVLGAIPKNVEGT